MRTITLLFTLACAHTLSAQQDYLVTMKSDTLHGPVQILSYDVIDRASIKVDGKKQNFTAMQIRSIYRDSITYAPVQHDKKIRFMQVLRAGYLTLYGYRQENQSNYDNRLLTKMNGTSLQVPNINFKKILAGYLEDCESTASKVREGEFERSDLLAIVDDYNACIAEQNKVATSIVKPSPALEAVASLRDKVQASTIDGKKDVVDMLNDMEGRMQRGQPIPPYLTNGIKSSLSGQKEFEVELDKLLSLLN